MEAGGQTIEYDRMSMISVASGVIQKRADKKAIREVKSFLHPPVGVKDVLTATFILMGRPESEVTWKQVQKELANFNLLQEIIELDIEKVTDDSRKQAMKYLSKYNADEIKKVSLTAAWFYDWAIAVARD